ncbi:PEGA domain-containing protein [bacterium]|nr:PEGA domain-containing protein [bacterium]
MRSIVKDFNLGLVIMAVAILFCITQCTKKQESDEVSTGADSVKTKNSVMQTTTDPVEPPISKTESVAAKVGIANKRTKTAERPKEPVAKVDQADTGVNTDEQLAEPDAANREVAVGVSETAPPVVRKEARVMHSVRIESNPSGARVVLKGKRSGGRYEGVTPLDIQVNPDWYNIEVSKANYIPNSKSELVDVKTRDKVEIHRQLIADDGVEGLMLQAERAEAEEDWVNAVQYYERVKSVNKAQYFAAQNRMGIIYLNHEDDLEKAINSFKEGLKYKKNDYALHFNLAQAYYRAQDYNIAIESVNEVSRLKARIPPAKLPGIEADIVFLIGNCKYALFRNETDIQTKNKIGYQAIQAYSDFIDQAPVTLAQYEEKKKVALEALGKIRKDVQ